jgi:hypothetical protein
MTYIVVGQLIELHEQYTGNAAMSTAKASKTKKHRRYLRIKCAFVRRGKTFLGVSVRLNVSKSAITKVATGQSRSRRIEAALAETAGIPLQELWK